MSSNFFDRLETELGELTRRGMHLDAVARGRHRAVSLLKHSVLVGALALALAVSLASEFPASANGRALLPSTAVVHNL